MRIPTHPEKGRKVKEKPKQPTLHEKALASVPRKELFQRATEKFSRHLKRRCFNECGTGLLFIWDQRDFFAPKTMEDKFALVTICAKCLREKMTTNPPQEPRVVSLDLNGAGMDTGADSVLPVHPDDLFDPSYIRYNRVKWGATKVKS